jgi:glycosyltransferase involved in cell wall biosynthesis
MKVVHLPNSFLPHYSGGKEVYTLRFSQALANLGVENFVIIPNHTDKKESYEYEGIKVISLPKVKQEHPYSSRYTRIASEMPFFRETLKDIQPDIVHFHDQNDGASLSHLKEAKSQHIKSVITFHTPGQVCPQHSLLYAGKKICDGKLEIIRCTQCQLQSFFNMPVPLAKVSVLLGNMKNEDPKNRIQKLMSHKFMTQRFINSYYDFANMADRIIVFSDWAKQTFLINDIDSSKIEIIDTGGNRSIELNFDKQKNDCFEVCFIGRCEKIKGIHLLIEAVKRIKDIPIKVYFYSSNWGETNYGRKLLEIIKDDERFTEPKLIENAKLMACIKKHDACVIPSIWPETGPLTVFDAFGAGLPIIGANSAGIAYRVRNGIDGLLFKNGSVEDLKTCIIKLATNYDLYNHLKKNILPNRTMDDVARETLKLYKSILK